MKISPKSSILVLCFMAAVVTTSQGAAPGKDASTSAPSARGVAKKSPLRTLGGGDTCGLATPVTTLPYNDVGTTVGAANDVGDVPICNTLPSPNVPGPDVIYSFTVGTGNSVTINLTPTAPYDADIYVLSTCGDPTSCVAWSALDVSCGSGCTETIGPTSLAPGTYYLYIDSFYSTDPTSGAPRFNPGKAQGAYSLSITGNLGVIAPTATNTPTITPSATPTNTSTVTPTATPTNTGTVTPSTTPTITPTFTATQTPTSSPTSTVTNAPLTATPGGPSPTPTGLGGPGGPSSPVPTLSGGMLALFGIALAAAAALLLTRRA